MLGVNCEICGKKISGKPLIMRIAGAILYVCDKCTENRKTLVIPISRDYVRPKKRVKLKSASAVVKGNKKIFPEFSLKPIDDYDIRIRKRREELGMTLVDLARAAGIRESLLRKIEGRKIAPGIPDLRKLERVLRIKLIGEIEEEPI